MDRMCENCGCDNVPDWDDYCPNCGDKVPSGKCPFCGADVYPSNHYKCPRCGADIREDYATHMAKVHATLEACRRQEEAQARERTQKQVIQDRDEHLPENSAQAKPKGKPWRSWKDAFMDLSFLLSFVAMVGIWIKGISYVRGDSIPFLIVVGIAIILLILVILGKLVRQYNKTKKIPILYIVLTALLYWGMFTIADGFYQDEINKENAYNQVIAYAQQKQWEKAKDTLSPYFYDDNKFWYLNLYVSSALDWSEKKYDRGSLSDDMIAKLPTVLQADARALKKQEDAYTYYSLLKEDFVYKPELQLKKGTYPSTLIKSYLAKYTDTDLPEEFQADSAMLRQFVLEQAEIEKENPDYFREPIEKKTPVFSHSFAKNTPKSQKAKDEEDYSRGYDDGRFSAAEGIWEDYDENESEAYINGYQDGQGEAREEMEDERQRQQQQKSSK